MFKCLGITRPPRLSPAVTLSLGARICRTWAKVYKYGRVEPPTAELCRTCSACGQGGGGGQPGEETDEDWKKEEGGEFRIPEEVDSNLRPLVLEELGLEELEEEET
jgi:hypothetical protein